MSHLKSPTPSYTDVCSQIKTLENTKRNNPKFERILVKTNSEKQKNEFETVLKNENLTYDFVNKLTKKANKFGYAVFYKVSPNHQNISYNLIEKITVPLNN